jgi:hypothetical protein
LVASDKGFTTGMVIPIIYICSNCKNPTYFDLSLQVPGVAFGNKVEYLPSDVEKLYNEARFCMSVNAFTASILVCRKILLHLAVSKKGSQDLTFEKAVEYLASIGYVPPEGKGWVDQIRKKSNEANHEIKLMTQKDAEELVSFLEMLLKFMYEFPSRAPKSTTP